MYTTVNALIIQKLFIDFEYVHDHEQVEKFAGC